MDTHADAQMTALRHRRLGAQDDPGAGSRTDKGIGRPSRKAEQRRATEELAPVDLVIGELLLELRDPAVFLCFGHHMPPSFGPPGPRNMIAHIAQPGNGDQETSSYLLSVTAAVLGLRVQNRSTQRRHAVVQRVAVEHGVAAEADEIVSPAVEICTLLRGRGKNRSRLAGLATGSGDAIQGGKEARMLQLVGDTERDAEIELADPDRIDALE